MIVVTTISKTIIVEAMKNSFYVDVSDATKTLNQLKHAVNRTQINLALARTINRIVTPARREAITEIKKEYKVPTRFLTNNKNVRVTKASRTKPTGQISVWGTPIGVRHFNARRTRKGISVNIKGKRTLIKSAFINPGMKAGSNRVVFARGKYGAGGFEPGKSRLPITPIVTVSQGVMFSNENVVGAMLSSINEKFPKRFEHELRFILSGIQTKATKNMNFKPPGF